MRRNREGYPAWTVRNLDGVGPLLAGHQVNRLTTTVPGLEWTLPTVSDDLHSMSKSPDLLRRLRRRKF
jgi:hypothetical protein